MTIPGKVVQRVMIFRRREGGLTSLISGHPLHDNRENMQNIGKNAQFEFFGPPCPKFEKTFLFSFLEYSLDLNLLIRPVASCI